MKNAIGFAMEPLKPPSIKDEYCSEHDWEILGFHDCRVFGVRWATEGFDLAIDLEYIVQWVHPASPGGSFQFWVCPAEIRFSSVCDAAFELNWVNTALGCSIQDLMCEEQRKTPNGMTERKWVFHLNDPEGRIEIWSTGFRLKMTGPPVLSLTQVVTSRELSDPPRTKSTEKNRR